MRIVLMATTALGLTMAATSAQDATVHEIDVTTIGIHTVKIGEITDDPDLPGEQVAEAVSADLVEETTTIPAKIGTEFGFQYIVVGTPDKADVTLDFVFTYPEPGLDDPQHDAPILTSRFSKVRQVGGIFYTGYGFENDWELVPGTWTFTVWYDGEQMAEQSFTVTK